MARKGGIPLKAYPRFFHEYRQFYQADFSSYTSTAKFNPKGGGDGKAKTSTDTYFIKSEGSDNSGMATEGGRFTYSSDRKNKADSYEDRYATLAKMFESVDSVVDQLIEMDRVPDKVKKEEKSREEPDEDEYFELTAFFNFGGGGESSSQSS